MLSFLLALLAFLLFLLLFLLLLALLEQFLEVVHHLLVGQDAELDEQLRVALLHQGDELHGRGVVQPVAVHVQVDQRRVLPQHLLDLLDHWDLLRLAELVVADVELAQRLVGLEGPEQLVDSFVPELVADEGKHLDLAVVVGEYLLQVQRPFVVDIAVIERQLLQRVILRQPDRQVLQSLRPEFIVTQVEFEDGHHVLGVERVAEVAAADGRDLVDFQLKLLDGLGGLHVLAERLESLVVGLEVGEDHDLEVLVAALLAEGLEDGLRADHAHLLPEHELRQLSVTFLMCGVSPSSASSILLRNSFDAVTPSYSHFLR